VLFPQKPPTLLHTLSVADPMTQSTESPFQ
jgi:hypothetical protein